jgi:hypothetical protein
MSTPHQASAFRGRRTGRYFVRLRTPDSGTITAPCPHARTIDEARTHARLVVDVMSALGGELHPAMTRVAMYEACRLDPAKPGDVEKSIALMRDVSLLWTCAAEESALLAGRAQAASEERESTCSSEWDAIGVVGLPFELSIRFERVRQLYQRHAEIVARVAVRRAGAGTSPMKGGV